MATVTIREINIDATVLASFSQSAQAGGDQVANDGDIYLLFQRNTSGPTNVTFAAAGLACNYGTKHDEVVVIPATAGQYVVGPFPVDRFNDSSGFLTWTYDAATGVGVGAHRVPRS